MRFKSNNHIGMQFRTEKCIWKFIWKYYWAPRSEKRSRNKLFLICVKYIYQFI